MSVLTKEAAVLRESAARLELAAAVTDAPQSAEDLLRRFGPEALSYTQRIDLELANDPGFVESTIKRAGLALGVEIGKRLRATFKGLQRPDFKAPYCVLAAHRVAEYRATVYAMTPEELKRLLEIAYRAGREEFYPPSSVRFL